MLHATVLDVGGTPLPGVIVHLADDATVGAFGYAGCHLGAWTTTTPGRWR